MNKIFLWIQNQNRRLLHFIMLLLASVAIVQFISRELHFYEYEKGKPWMHDDLIAPFTFSILKTTDEIEDEKKVLIKTKEYFFFKDDSLVYYNRDILPQKVKEVLTLVDSASLEGKEPYISKTVLEIYDRIYNSGIVEIPEELLSRDDKTIFLKNGVVNNQIDLAEFFTISTAGNLIKEETVGLDSLDGWVIYNVLTKSVQPNVLLDRELTQKSLDAKLELILPYRGQVQEGETVIFKGNLIDDLKLSKLNSLKVAYEGSFWKRANFLIIFIGRVALIFGILTLLYFVLLVYYPDLLLTNKNLTLFLIHLLVVIAITALIKELNGDWFFASPILLLPIIYMSFFDNKLAIILSFVGVLIIAFLVPNGFEFLVMEGIMILMVSTSYQGFLKRGHFFVTIGKILGIYILFYLLYALIQEGSFEEIDYEQLLLFAISCFLGLFAIPILYIYEKVFRLLSDTTLLELSDINNKLLRQLSEKAPGTFQHTLQVANLAEKGVLAIGGKTLLVRTGALYHDIGKMLNPQYFVENQITGVNPHDELSFKESAEIIISHVIKGVELARRSKLPDEIIDFIRTHHGTTRVEYFYRMYLKNYPEDEKSVKEFTYPGPKPYSKETAVLMMADSIEAATRSLKDKNQENIQNLIEKIISSQISLGQFDNADLTFKDITVLKRVFLKSLLNVYHLRVEYPD